MTNKELKRALRECKNIYVYSIALGDHVKVYKNDIKKAILAMPDDLRVSYIVDDSLYIESVGY